uniref:Uncharacterized protein n=1 Tax=Melopsittacus undulatus TaxID=13146 RepID=A0A8V5H9L4_MELUD
SGQGVRKSSPILSGRNKMLPALWYLVLLNPRCSPWSPGAHRALCITDGPGGDGKCTMFQLSSKPTSLSQPCMLPSTQVTPLCLAARRGHTAVLRHLLRRRADPDVAPGGRGPLHEACLGAHTECAALLLQHRAEPDLRSDQGLAPLHLCTTRDSLGCAKLLLRHGATVNLPSEDRGETALHVAARHCLCDHAWLYLRHGAHVDALSMQEETALSILCGQAPGTEGCLQLSPSTPNPLPCNKIHLEVTHDPDHSSGTLTTCSGF